jgi:hypothetical protein
MVDKPIFEFDETPGVPVNVNDPRTLGIFLCNGVIAPPGEEEFLNQYAELNFTGPPGAASALYYALMFQLPNWNYHIAKIDEWIEVSPTHKEYYERTAETKRMLEGVIKSGLTSSAQAVGDFELIKHDMRKYKEIMDYFARKDEHSLKAMFIDQVDVHTGEGVAMKLIAPRWPTIISDFMKIEDSDMEPDEVSKKLNVSKAEGVILVTKNKLYQEWKKLFGTAARERYETLKGMVHARQKSVNEYKEWLKPYIARFKMTKLGGERKPIRAETFKSFADITGEATFANGIRIYAWKILKSRDIRKPAAEIKRHGFIIYPYDNYIRENFILDTRKGLAHIYPWLNNDRKYCKKCNSYFSPVIVRCEKCGTVNLQIRKLADEIIEKEIIPAWKKKEMALDPTEMYYVFFDFDVLRLGSRLPVGELEDITFEIKTYVLSQNIMLVKLLELKCRERELERYIDEMLGISLEERSISDLMKEEYPDLFPKEKPKTEFEKFVSGFTGIKKGLGKVKKVKMPKIPGLMLAKPGQYERDFKEKITKQYLKISAEHFLEILGFLKAKMGIE